MISGGIFHYWALKGFNYLSVSMSNNQTQSDLHILTALIFGLSFCLFLSSSSILTISGSAMSIGVEPYSKYIAVSTISFAGIKVAITLHIKNTNRRQLGCWPVNSWLPVWLGDAIDDWHNDCLAKVSASWFVWPQTNKFQGLFKDFKEKLKFSRNKIHFLTPPPPPPFEYLIG